jgi:hypothetical protein
MVHRQLMGNTAIGHTRPSPYSFNHPGLDLPEFSLQLDPVRHHEYLIHLEGGQSLRLAKILVPGEPLLIPGDAYASSLRLAGPSNISCVRKQDPASGPIDYECTYVHEHGDGDEQGEHEHSGFRLSEFILTSDGWAPPHMPHQPR